jgi:hypothetical protein
MVDTNRGHADEKVCAEQRSQHKSDQRHEDDGDADRGQPGSKVGAGLFDVVDDVEAVLNRGETNRRRPDGCDQGEGQLAAGGGDGGLVEGFEYGAQRIVRDDDGEIAQQRVVDPRRRTRSQPKQRGRGKQAGKESKDEKETQFGSPPD